MSPASHKLLVGPRFYGKTRSLGDGVYLDVSVIIENPRRLLGTERVALVIDAVAHNPRLQHPLREALAEAKTTVIALLYNAAAHDEAAVEASLRRLPSYLTRRLKTEVFGPEDPFENPPLGWNGVEVEAWKGLVGGHPYFWRQLRERHPGKAPRPTDLAAMLKRGGTFGRFAVAFTEAMRLRPEVRSAMGDERAITEETQQLLESWDMDAPRRTGKLSRLIGQTLLDSPEP